MKIRNSLSKYEKLDYELKSASIIKMFLGSCIGVVLIPRGIKDDHILMKFLVEDDEYWYLSSNQGISSSWLKEYLAALKAAKKWLKENCDPDLHDGRQYGWKIRRKV